MALRDISTCLIKCCKWFWVTGAKSDEDDEAPLCVECHYSRQAQYLGRLYLHLALFALARLREVLLLRCVWVFRAILRSRRNIWWRCKEDEEKCLPTALATIDLTLPTLHSSFTLHPLHSLSTLNMPHFTPYTRHCTLHTPHFTTFTTFTPSHLHTLHPTLRPPPSTLHTLHPALHPPPSTLHTLHPTLHPPHSTLHNLHTFTPSHLHTFTPSHLHTFTPYTRHSTLHPPPSTLHTLHPTLHPPPYTLHPSDSTLHAPRFTLHTPHFTLQTLNSTLHNAHSTLDTLHTALHHSALHSLSLQWYDTRERLYKPVVITSFEIYVFCIRVCGLDQVSYMQRLFTSNPVKLFAPLCTVAVATPCCPSRTKLWMSKLMRIEWICFEVGKCFIGRCWSRGSFWFVFWLKISSTTHWYTGYIDTWSSEHNDKK